MAKAKTTKTLSEEVKNLTTELFNLLGIEAQIEVSEQDEETLEVHIDSPDETGLLIGSHGATLQAIQVFLGMAVRQQTGEWKRIVVNIGDWKEKQEEHLGALADQAVSRVKSTGEAQRLYHLSPTQRRVIHMLLSEDKEVVTESEGEGEDRHLVIKLKS